MSLLIPQQHLRHNSRPDQSDIRHQRHEFCRAVRAGLIFDLP